jgi:hypothetical protein
MDWMCRRRQRGAALFALLLVTVVGALGYLLAVVTPVNRVVLEREHNARLLREAKDAVLGWAVANAADTSDPNPGKLPCPEALGNFTNPPSSNEGVMQGFCAGASTAVGRLPWRSLGIEKPYDASGEVLWYVVAPGWKRPNNTTPEPPLGLNSNSRGALAVDGQPSAAVAAIIAPGARMGLAPTPAQLAQGCATRSQARTIFPPPDSLDYLECQNVAGASLRTGVTGNAANAIFNDQVVIVTAAEVMAVVEAVVAKRIESTVAPQLAAMYAAAPWGATATDPIFPFAAPFADPSTSAYQGAAGTTQGLLPLTSSSCNALTAGRCDSVVPFVAWDTSYSASIGTTSGAATVTGSNCTVTASTVHCTISYTASCSSAVPSSACSASVPIAVTARALNVGMAMRSLSASPVSGMTSVTIPSAAIGGTSPIGSAAVEVRGNVSSGSCVSAPGATCSIAVTNAAVTIPVSVFADHALANPSSSDAWYWFIANKWHQVTYYGVSPSHTPGGGRNCGAASDCITVKVAGAAALANRKAILVLAGRSINGSVRPSGNRADYLDSTENNNDDQTFAQQRIGRGFNDRVVSVAYY